MLYITNSLVLHFSLFEAELCVCASYKGRKHRLYQHRDELVKILQEVAEFPQKYIEMGILAMEYYKQNASISQMVQGFYDAISFVQIDNQWKN